MNLPTLGHHLLLLGLAGAAGYALRGFNPCLTLASPLDAVPQVEHFATARTFSEVEQTRRRLHGLALHHLYEVQVRAVTTGRLRRPTGESLGAGCQELETAIAEFRGTGEELVLTHGLLMLLASEDTPTRWVEVYLDLLYRHPTEALVGQLAESAVAKARVTGQLEAVLEALRHLTHIPLDFEAKHRAHDLLRDTTLVRTPAPPELHQNLGLEG